MISIGVAQFFNLGKPIFVRDTEDTTINDNQRIQQSNNSLTSIKDDISSTKKENLNINIPLDTEHDYDSITYSKYIDMTYKFEVSIPNELDDDVFGFLKAWRLPKGDGLIYIDYPTKYIYDLSTLKLSREDEFNKSDSLELLYSKIIKLKNGTSAYNYIYKYEDSISHIYEFIYDDKLYRMIFYIRTDLDNINEDYYNEMNRIFKYMSESFNFNQ